MLLKLFIISAILSLAFSQVVPNFPYSNLSCVTTSSTTSFIRGSTAYLCVHFITYDSVTQAMVPQRVAFPLVVDDYTSVQVQGGHNNLTSLGDFSQIVVQAHGSVSSTPLTYFQLANKFYSDAFSVVIQISLGNITSVTWNHECSTCGYSECYAFTNGDTRIDSICNDQSCDSAAPSSECDPQIYVTWIGSDANNVKMTSAAMRPSRFRQFTNAELAAAQTIPNFVSSNQTQTSTATPSSKFAEL